MVIKGEFV